MSTYQKSFLQFTFFLFLIFTHLGAWAHNVALEPSCNLVNETTGAVLGQSHPTGGFAVEEPNIDHIPETTEPQVLEALRMERAAHLYTIFVSFDQNLHAHQLTATFEVRLDTDTDGVLTFDDELDGSSEEIEKTSGFHRFMSFLLGGNPYYVQCTWCHGDHCSR